MALSGRRSSGMQERARAVFRPWPEAGSQGGGRTHCAVKDFAPDARRPRRLALPVLCLWPMTSPVTHRINGTRQRLTAAAAVVHAVLVATSVYAQTDGTPPRALLDTIDAPLQQSDGPAAVTPQAAPVSQTSTASITCASKIGDRRECPADTSK